ncbi:conserved hypothetical protein [Talaromyces stipitatus ATCC 10500]|uniref:Xylanolytic transcriptional activator regulatory domain-containing protein n=1 Tax=Talaromyces stipitatus (strain ATCC 10500 / CBS 375.48 / QM 6759 / NRRL 1006) TaxID=441959 RepID=B8M7L4_TALSN|nr:uncharacterized protein TSTA_028540 [Talaromyces stipitatus ATCC 10500]EED19572.1 conserved hypothetical protein [Talaromyces stipitatus ATCC 10500]
MSQSDKEKIASLPHAQREIESLRRQVKDLQRELWQLRQREDKHIPSPPANLPTPELSFSESSHSESDNVSQGTNWGGIYFRTARSPHETWYGPSSLFYFMGRMTNFLNLTLEQTQSKDQMVPESVSRRLDGPLASNDEKLELYRHDSQTRNETEHGHYLTPTQEEYFLDLYWNSYHTSLFPIIDEIEFKQHYRSLWTTSGNARKDSALVDIVIALGMQYGISMTPNMKYQFADNSDATIAGRWYYRRCQSLLAYELESPTLATLQCHILSIIYLCSGSFQNMSDSTCAVAVRTVHMLGLHLDPPQTMPRKEREIRKRLWWALLCADSKLGLKLGRPFLLHQTNTTPKLPGDDVEAAMLSGSSFAPLGDNATWLSFNLHHTTLFLVAREAHTAFYSRDLNLQNGQTVWDDFNTLESQAEFIYPFVKKLENWTNGVPSTLATKRKSGSRPFATVDVDLEIEQFAPLWLQRQRVILELMYHNLSANLCRPFISFALTPPLTVVEEMAFKCASHAIALTKITYQILSSTTILSGWHEVFQWQWNVAMTLVGFVLAYPRISMTVAARDAINLSVSVFDIFGNSFAVANSAATIVRNLITKIDFLAKHAWRRQSVLENHKEDTSQVSAIPSDIVTSQPEPYMDNNSLIFQSPDNSLEFGDMSLESMQDMFHMAFDIDQWSDLSGIWSQAGGV